MHPSPLGVRRRCAVSLAAGLVGSLVAVASPSDVEGGGERQRADPAVTRADIEACVSTLASDEMKGRATGTPECEKAGLYLAAGLKRAGVAPAGDDGGYTQAVPLARVEYRSAPKLVAWTGAEQTHERVQGVDFTFAGGVASKRGRLRVRIVTKAEQVPAEPDEELALFLDGTQREQREWLGEKRGAGFGLIVTPGSPTAGTAPDTRTPRSRDLPGEQARSSVARIQANGELLSGLRDGTIKALRLELQSELIERRTFNVIGKIAGVGTAERPELAQEAIVFSAHYDHIGVDSRAAEGADAIRNGADDDASGCAAVMELAEAFAAGPPPARTLIFLFATGEEIGLVGTHHYINYPVAPLERTAANLNFEMIGRPDELIGGAGKLWLTGFEMSNLGPRFRELGLAIESDQRPDQNFFQRSDNYAFAVKGVVAQTLSSYNLHRDYHRVSDEPATLDYAHMESCVRAALEGARALADGRIDPAWAPGKNPKR